jgi:hypothetical protein
MFSFSRNCIILLILFAACAHKTPPISKDRLKPKLTSVTALNNRQIQLSFSEEIDTVALFPDSMLITSAQETLGILSIYPSLSASEIVLVTTPMTHTAYEISGHVLDKGENKGPFKHAFQGSANPDTIAPWLVDFSQGRLNHEFFLVFSETMDTTSITYSVVPKKQPLPDWLTHRHVKFSPQTPSESLSFDTTYYLFLRNANDISGNPAPPFVTAVTPDTMYRPDILTGKVFIDETPAPSGIAILQRDIIIGIALIEKGEFVFEVRDSLPFDLHAVSGDYTGTSTVKADSENIIKLLKGEFDLDRLID